MGLTVMFHPSRNKGKCHYQASVSSTFFQWDVVEQFVPCV